MSPRLTAPGAWRQSAISRFNSCPLSLRFDLDLDLRQLPGQIGILGARGVLFHRFAAAAINYMRAEGLVSIPAAEALAILARVVAQREFCDSDGRWRPLPAEEVVLLPMSELRWLRVQVTRWATRHEFRIDRVVDVERRLEADLEVIGPGGVPYLQRITGQPDVLLAGPREDEATVLDWKTGWAPPARRTEPTAERPEPEDRLSEMGYVQQVVYGWLVLKSYPSLYRVTEREYYVAAKDGEDPVREATVTRDDMERIEDALAMRVSEMDAAIEEGPESPRWFPVPGAHCGFCVGRRFCPIRKHFGVPDSLEEAQLLGQEWHVAGEIRKERIPYVKGWIDAEGPIPIKHAKGRRVIGFGPTGLLRLYEPREVEPPPSEFDADLVTIAREAGVLTDE